MSNNRHFPDVKLKFQELVGEKIKSIECMKAEHGRTYSQYLLIKCESGKRVMLKGGNPYSPNPTLEKMREADFFEPEEVASKVEWLEKKKKRKKEEEKERKKRQLEKLKKELGEE